MSEETISAFIELLLQATILVVVPALATIFAKWLLVKVDATKASIPSEVLWTIEAVAKMVVEAAEQSGLKDELLAEGADKKAWAMQYGEDLLRQQLGLHLDLNKLGDAFWESVLKGLNVAVEQQVYRLGAKPPPGV